MKTLGGERGISTHFGLLYILDFYLSQFKKSLRVWLSNNVNVSGIIMIILIINRKHNYSVFQAILKNRGNKTLYKMW